MGGGVVARKRRGNERLRERPKVRILALVKYSIDASEVRVDSTTGALRLANVPRRFGDIDRNVIEAAVRVKEAPTGPSGSSASDLRQRRESSRR